MEEKILRAVSEVTGVPMEDIRGDSRRLEVVRARMMYYYLCNDKGLLFNPVARFVGRTDSAVSQGVSSFSFFIRNNKKYASLAKEAKNLLLGMRMDDGLDWVSHNGHEYIYVMGVKYSIHDVSSRYFGKGYMGMIDGDYALFCEDREEAVKGLINMIGNGI